jgi:hypothetical protein
MLCIKATNEQEAVIHLLIPSNWYDDRSSPLWEELRPLLGRFDLITLDLSEITLEYETVMQLIRARREAEASGTLLMVSSPPRSTALTSLVMLLVEFDDACSSLALAA